MASSKETIANTPLRGSELRRLIDADIAAILDADPMLGPSVAYYRVGYELTLKLMLDNPCYPQHDILVRSRRPSDQQIEADPQRAAVEPPPLANPSPDALVQAPQRTRQIASPNAARVASGLPVPLTIRGQDGHWEETEARYDPSQVEIPPEAMTVTDADRSEDVSREWKKP